MSKNHETDATRMRHEANRSDVKSLWEHYANRFLAVAVVLVLVIGTVVYHYIEGWGWTDSFYFCAVAGSTVGFGDLTPTTPGSKLFTVLYLSSAVTILGTFFDQRLKHHGVGRKRLERKVAQSETDDETTQVASGEET